MLETLLPRPCIWEPPLLVSDYDSRGGELRRGVTSKNSLSPLNTVCVGLASLVWYAKPRVTFRCKSLEI